MIYMDKMQIKLLQEIFTNQIFISLEPIWFLQYDLLFLYWYTNKFLIRLPFLYLC